MGNRGDPTKAKEIPDNQKCDRIPRPGGGGGRYQEENGAGIRDFRNQKCWEEVCPSSQGSQDTRLFDS